jgi:hypothetical protein
MLTVECLFTKDFLLYIFGISYQNDKQENKKMKTTKPYKNCKSQILTAMKRMFFLALLTIAFGSATYARELVAEGNSNSALGNFKIETADNPVVINGETFNALVVTYENSPMEVTIVVKPGKNCKNYIVLSSKLSVQYVCNENYFGVERLDKTLNVEGFNTADAAVNRTEYFRQKKLTSGMRPELENTQLIASYFPMLLPNV